MHRSHLPKAERELRSRLAKLVHEQPLLRGTLTVRQVTCGNANCRCAKGNKHEALYLTYGKQGKPYQVFIPRDLHEQVRGWSENYRCVLELVEQLCELSQEELKALKSKGK